MKFIMKFNQKKNKDNKKQKVNKVKILMNL